MVLIAVVTIGIFMVFSSEIEEYFPNTITTGIESFKLDLSNIFTSSLNRAEHQIESSTHQITSSLDTARDETINTAAQTIRYTEQQLEITGEKLDEDLTHIQDASTNLVESLPGT